MLQKTVSVSTCASLILDVSHPSVTVAIL